MHAVSNRLKRLKQLERLKSQGSLDKRANVKHLWGVITKMHLKLNGLTYKQSTKCAIWDSSANHNMTKAPVMSFAHIMDNHT